MLLIFLIFLFLINFRKYYVHSYIFNGVSFFFWLSLDSFDYYLSFLVWLSTAILTVFLNLVYSYFFFNYFSTKTELKKIFGHKSFPHMKNFTNFSKKDLFISKHDLNWVLYSWLTSGKSPSNSLIVSKIIEDIFSTNINQKWWFSFYDVFTQIYKISLLLNLSTSKYNLYNIQATLTNVDNNNIFNYNYFPLLSYLLNSSLLTKNSSLFLMHVLKNQENYFSCKTEKNDSTLFLNTRYEWNLFNLHNELSNHPSLLRTKVGLFLFNDFNYTQLMDFAINFNEMRFINNCVKNQLDAAKWNRWLYRYSILHRRTLKNSHKITISKRLLNSGIYDSKLFDKNLWASEYLSKYPSSQHFASLFNIFYKELFIKNNNNNNLFTSYLSRLNGNNNQLASLNLLSAYENSFLWFVKRFYLFNTLPSNFIKSGLKINNINLDKDLNNFYNQSSEFNKYSIIFSYLLKSNYVNNNNYSHFKNNDLSIFDYFDNLENQSHFKNALKDLYISTFENDLLSKDNLDILCWITTSSLNSDSVSFFNHLSYQPFSHRHLRFKKSQKGFSRKYYDINYQLNRSLLNIDNYYLLDIAYLTLFY